MRREAHNTAHSFDVFDPVDCDFSLSRWLTRELPEPDYLLGNWLTTTSRALIVGPTGLGKTNFALALGMSVAAGSDFLHWHAHRPARVLFIDGEMSRRLMKQRLADACRRLGAQPEGLFVLSREDFPDMAPLNTPEGQDFIDAHITRLGGVDLVEFDNIQALLTGSMKEEDQWQETLPWVRDLTRRGIGQIWFHHTGHDETRSYGSKAREWQLDTVALMEKDEAPVDVSFSITFKKARERTPDNRADFEPVSIALVNDEWTCNRGASSRRPPSPKAAAFRDALTDAMAGYGETHKGRPAVKQALWRAECERKGLVDKPSGDRTHDNRQSALFSKYRAELVASKHVVVDGDFAWLA